MRNISAAMPDTATISHQPRVRYRDTKYLYHDAKYGNNITPGVRKIQTRPIPLLQCRILQWYHVRREEEAEMPNISAATPNTATLWWQVWGHYRVTKYLCCNAEYLCCDTKDLCCVAKYLSYDAEDRNDNTPGMRKIYWCQIPVPRRQIPQRYHTRGQEKLQRRQIPLLNAEYRNDTSLGMRKVQRCWIPQLRCRIVQR